MFDDLNVFDTAIKGYKTIKKKMTNPEIQEKDKLANGILRNHVIWSMGAGFIPIAVADIIAVSAVQLDMIKQLSRVYEIDYKETEGKAIITALSGSILARMGASAVKLIPGIGSVIGGASVSIMSGAATYALGEVFKKHFQTGGTFLDFDPNRMKVYYQEKFEKGKKVTKEWKEQAEREEAAAKAMENTIKTQTNSASKAEKITHSRDLIDRLERLVKMKENGVIDEVEFKAMKQKLIEGE